MTGLRGSGEAAVGDLAGGLQVERPEPTSVVLSTAGSAEQASSAERKKRVPHAESWRGEAGRTQVPRSGIAGGGGQIIEILPAPVTGKQQALQISRSTHR